MLAYVRLTTRAAAFTNPLTSEEALDAVDGWLTQPAVTVVHPTSRHPTILRELLKDLGTAGTLTTDAHLAALAIEHGAVLCSHDGDFARFPGLQWEDPLRR
jgi:toxin-antitoxin system PIN domain toxin